MGEAHSLCFSVGRKKDSGRAREAHADSDRWLGWEDSGNRGEGSRFTIAEDQHCIRGVGLASKPQGSGRQGREDSEATHTALI